jgi:hypothetical protein
MLTRFVLATLVSEKQNDICSFPIVYFSLLYAILSMYAYFAQVVDVMKDNLDKVLERDTKLTTLENRAGKI